MGPITVRLTSRALPQKTHGRRRLLVVDDYQPGAEAITASLSQAGYDAQLVLRGMAVMPALDD